MYPSEARPGFLRGTKLIRCFVKVGSKDAHAALSQMYEKVKTDRRVAALGFDKILEQAANAHAEVKTMSSDIDDWRPAEWAAKRTTGDNILDKYQTAFQNLLEYKPSIELALEHQMKAQRLTTRNKNNACKKYEDVLVQCSCPEALSGLIASELSKRKGDHNRGQSWMNFISFVFVGGRAKQKKEEYSHKLNSGTTYFRELIWIRDIPSEFPSWIACIPNLISRLLFGVQLQTSIRRIPALYFSIATWNCIFVFFLMDTFVFVLHSEEGALPSFPFRVVVQVKRGLP